MTIFDSIKYPISNPPTLQELEALPDEMYKAWQDATGFTLSRQIAALLFQLVPASTGEHSPETIKQIEMFRTIIAEYNNDNI
jgi:hypothetical protein